MSTIGHEAMTLSLYPGFLGQQKIIYDKICKPADVRLASTVVFFGEKVPTVAPQSA